MMLNNERRRKYKENRELNPCVCVSPTSPHENLALTSRENVLLDHNKLLQG